MRDKTTKPSPMRCSAGRATRHARRQRSHTHSSWRHVRHKFTSFTTNIRIAIQSRHLAAALHSRSILSTPGDDISQDAADTHQRASRVAISSTSPRSAPVLTRESRRRRRDHCRNRHRTCTHGTASTRSSVVDPCAAWTSTSMCRTCSQACPSDRGLWAKPASAATTAAKAKTPGRLGQHAHTQPRTDSLANARMKRHLHGIASNLVHTLRLVGVRRRHARQCCVISETRH